MYDLRAYGKLGPVAGDRAALEDQGGVLGDVDAAAALLKEQKKHMGMYLNCLEIRAEIEGIEL